MRRTLDERYLTWLYRQVALPRESLCSYWELFRELYKKEFIWIIPNDDNRAEDGRVLRKEFAEIETVDDPSGMWMGLGSSFLEMLIGLSRRLSFETDRDSRLWFWDLLENLQLEMQHDGLIEKQTVNEALDVVIWRTYEYNGDGGLFPLGDPQEDQRDVELWYQMCSYLLEKGY